MNAFAIIPIVCSVISVTCACITLFVTVANMRPRLLIVPFSKTTDNKGGDIEWQLDVTCMGPGNAYGLRMRTQEKKQKQLIATVLKPGETVRVVMLMKWDGIETDGPVSEAAKLERRWVKITYRPAIPWRGRYKQRICNMKKPIGEPIPPIHHVTLVDKDDQPVNE